MAHSSKHGGKPYVFQLPLHATKDNGKTPISISECTAIYGCFSKQQHSTPNQIEEILPYVRITNIAYIKDKTGIIFEFSVDTTDELNSFYECTNPPNYALAECLLGYYDNTLPYTGRGKIRFGISMTNTVYDKGKTFFSVEKDARGCTNLGDNSDKGKGKDKNKQADRINKMFMVYIPHVNGGYVSSVCMKSVNQCYNNIILIKRDSGIYTTEQMKVSANEIGKVTYWYEIKIAYNKTISLMYSGQTDQSQTFTINALSTQRDCWKNNTIGYVCSFLKDIIQTHVLRKRPEDVTKGVVEIRNTFTNLTVSGLKELVKYILLSKCVNSPSAYALFGAALVKLLPESESSCLFQDKCINSQQAFKILEGLKTIKLEELHCSKSSIMSLCAALCQIYCQQMFCPLTTVVLCSSFLEKAILIEYIKRQLEQGKSLTINENQCLEDAKTYCIMLYSDYCKSVSKEDNIIPDVKEMMELLLQNVSFNTAYQTFIHLQSLKQYVFSPTEDAFHEKILDIFKERFRKEIMIALKKAQLGKLYKLWTMLNDLIILKEEMKETFENAVIQTFQKIDTANDDIQQFVQELISTEDLFTEKSKQGALLRTLADSSNILLHKAFKKVLVFPRFEECVQETIEECTKMWLFKLRDTHAKKRVDALYNEFVDLMDIEMVANQTEIHHALKEIVLNELQAIGILTVLKSITRIQPNAELLLGNHLEILIGKKGRDVKPIEILQTCCSGDQLKLNSRYTAIVICALLNVYYYQKENQSAIEQLRDMVNDFDFWIRIFYATGEYIRILHENSNFKSAEECLKKMVFVFKEHKVTFGYKERLEKKCKDGISRLLAFGGCKATDICQWQKEADSKFETELKNCLIVSTVMTEVKSRLAKTIPDECKYLLEYIDRLLEITGQATKKITRGKLTARDLETDIGIWVNMEELPEVCKQLHELVCSVVFWNVCSGQVFDEFSKSGDNETSEDVDSGSKVTVRKLDPMKKSISQFMQILMATGVTLYKNAWIEIQTNDSIQMTFVLTMFSGTFKQLANESEIAEKHLSKPFKDTTKITLKRISKIDEVEHTFEAIRLALNAFRINIEDDNKIHDAIASFEKLHQKTNLNITLCDVTNALQIIFAIAEELSPECVEILHAIGKSSLLLEFLEKIVDEDIRNLIDAVEDISEQHVRESTVSGLIEIKRFFNPLLQPSFERKGFVLFQEVERQTLKHEKTAKSLPSKINECMENLHNLKSLYNNVANRGEQTKETIANIVTKGRYQFLLSKTGICDITAIYEQAESSVSRSKVSLIDLRSRALLLMNTEWNESEQRLKKGDLETFVTNVDLCLEIAEIVGNLHASGHMDFGKYESLKESDHLRMVKDDLDSQFQHWQKSLSLERDSHYLMNFVTGTQVHTLYNYLENDLEKGAVVTLLKYIHPELNIKHLRDAYFNQKANTKESNDRDILHCMGHLLHHIFETLVFHQRKNPVKEEKETRITEVVQKGKLLVAQLEESSLLVVKTILALYDNTTQSLPEANQVLFCTNETTWSEIQLLLDRCLKACQFYGNIILYCVANVEMLSNELQFKLVEKLRHLNENDNFLLAIVCRGSKSHPFIDELTEYVTNIRPSTDQNICEIFAAECPHVVTFTSEIAGIGKSNIISKNAHKSHRKLVELHISGPVRKRSLIQRLRDLKIKSQDLLHFNIGTVDNFVELDTFLFELIILRHVTSGTLSVCLPTLHISIEIANTINDSLRNSLQTAMSFKREHLVWNDYKNFIVSKEIESSVQIVCHFLYNLETNTLDRTDLIFSGPTAVLPISSKGCRRLLRKHLITTKSLSFTFVNTFLNVLADQLKKMSCSSFFKTSRIRDMIGYKTIPTVKSTLVEALVEVSKEFATRSVETCRSKQTSTVTSNKSEDEKSSNFNIAEIATKRVEGMVQWEESNHLIYVFHNQNIQTISPMYRDLTKVPAHIRNLFEGQMKKEMQDFQSMDQKQLQTILQKIARTNPFPLPQRELVKLASEYALTPDNLLKMVLIMMRVKSSIPVIVMGETGCGKTSLISYLAEICEVPFEIMNIHAGVEEYDIIKKVRQSNNKALESLNLERWLFLDEINTTEHIGMISDIICHHRCQGDILAPNLTIMGACNPYKLRSTTAISTAGLQGRIKTDDLSKLVYRVLPLPEMLVDYVWDFGSLSQKDESIYIKRMIEDVSFPGSQKHHTLLSDLLSMSQQFVRDKERTTYSVSLRDVRRCKVLTQWFLTILERKQSKTSAVKKHDHNVAIIAIILALAHCYQSRFADNNVRQDYRSRMATIFWIDNYREYNKETIQQIVFREQRDILDRMELPPGTAKNTALQENVFIILVCILNRIPIFVVGKPGCSKSLAMQIIRSNLRGKDSKDDFFKTLPQLYCVSFQGSESSTSDGIIKVFEKAENYQNSNNEDDVLSVVILDEIGLAEISRFNPLKVLHSLLEPDTKMHPNVAVVGISNWSLDASKMNRAIHLSRPDMDKDELNETGKSISQSFEKEEDISLAGVMKSSNTFSTEDIKEDLKNIADSYYSYTQQLRFRNFHGLRDYYSLVKYIAKQLSQMDTKLSEEERSNVIMMGLERNFGGLPTEKDTLLCTFRGNLKMLQTTNIPVVDLIAGNIRDTLARHLMLITTGESVMGIVEEQLSKLHRNKREVIFGSQFEEDLTDDYNYRILSRISLCMEQGLVLILKDLENIYGSLYDMLNQNYTVIGKKKNCRVALGPYSNPICHVADTFRCIVLVDETKIDYTDPPFLNRFEKQYLRFADILNKEQSDLILYLERWIVGLCNIKGKTFTKKDAFPIYSEDMVASLILKFDKELPDDENKDMIISQYKTELLWIIKPETVLRLCRVIDPNIASDSENIKEQFFNLPVHGGMKDLLQYQLDKLNGNTDGLMTIVFTNSNIHTKGLHNVSERKTQIDKLGAFKSEKQLSLRMQNFWLESEDEILYLQCSAIDDEKHIMLAKSVIEHHRNEFQTTSSKVVKHVYLVIHVDRSKGVSRIVSQINFLSGWKLVMLDCLESPQTPLPELCSLTLYETIEKKRPLHQLIRERLFWTFTRIRYGSQGRNVESIKSILEKIKQSEDLLNILDGRIFSWIRVNSLDIHDTEWQINVACDVQALVTSATLVDALERHILNAINVPLSKTVYQMEVMSILDSFFEEDNHLLDRRTFWNTVLQNENTFSISKVPDESGPETFNCESRDLCLKMPFSVFLFDSIESTRDEFMDSLIILKSKCDLADDEDVPQEVLEVLMLNQENVILQRTPNWIQQLYENWWDDYINDFCNIVSFAVCSKLPREKRVKYMKWAISQNTSLSTTDPSELFVRLHSTFWIHSSLFNAELQLLEMCRDILFEDDSDILVEEFFGNRVLESNESQATRVTDSKQLNEVHEKEENESKIPQQTFMYNNQDTITNQTRTIIGQDRTESMSELEKSITKMEDRRLDLDADLSQLSGTIEKDDFARERPSIHHATKMPGEEPTDNLSVLEPFESTDYEQNTVLEEAVSAKLGAHMPVTNIEDIDVKMPGDCEVLNCDDHLMPTFITADRTTESTNELFDEHSPQIAQNSNQNIRAFETKESCVSKNVAKVKTLNKSFEKCSVVKSTYLKCLPDGNTASPHDILVDLVCKIMLPTKETLKGYNDIHQWQSIVNNVLTLVSQVSQRPKSVEGLRLCNDVAMELVIPFSLDIEYICIIGTYLQQDYSLDSEEIFTAVMNSIYIAPDESQMKCQRTLSNYITRCLKCFIDSKDKACKTKAFDYLLRLAENGTLPDNNCSLLKLPMYLAMMTEIEENETIFMDILQYKGELKASLSVKDESKTKANTEFSDNEDENEEDKATLCPTKADTENKEIHENKDKTTEKDGEDEADSDMEKIKTLERSRDNETPDNGEDGIEEICADSECDEDINSIESCLFICSLDICLRKMHQTGDGNNTFLVLLVDILEDIYRESLEDGENHAETNDFSTLLHCHKILTETGFGIQYMSALAYVKAFIFLLKSDIEDGNLTPNCIAALNGVFQDSGENTVNKAMLTYLLKVIGMDKVLNQLEATCSNLNEKLTFMQGICWTKSYPEECFEGCPLSIYVPTCEQNITTLFDETKDVGSLKRQIKSLTERANKSTEGMILLYSVALKKFYIPNSYMPMNDSRRTQASLLVDDSHTTLRKNKGISKRNNIFLLEGLVGTNNFLVQELVQNEEADSLSSLINPFLSSLYALLLSFYTFTKGNGMPFLTTCLLKPLELKKCFLPGFPENEVQPLTVYEIFSLKQKETYLITCQCGYRLSVCGRVDRCVICKAPLLLIKPECSGVSERNICGGYATCESMTNVYFGARQMYFVYMHQRVSSWIARSSIDRYNVPRGSNINSRGRRICYFMERNIVSLAEPVTTFEFTRQQHWLLFAYSIVQNTITAVRANRVFTFN